MPGQRQITVNWDVTTLQDKRLRDLLVYWLKLSGDRAIPSRNDFDPLDIPRLLPFLVLVDVLDDALDFRFRLTGTHFREFAGDEATGKMIGEVFPPDFCAEVRTHWGNSIKQRQPLLGKGELWVSGRDFIRWEGIILPLSPDGATVNMLLGGIVFISASDANNANSGEP
jgi:hypothetical protein